MGLMKFIRNSSEDFMQQTSEEFSTHAVSLIAIAFSLFQVCTAYFGAYTALIQRSVHLSFVMCIGFLVYPFRKNEGRTGKISDLVLAILGTGSCLYIVQAFDGLALRQGVPNTLDLIFGVIVLLTLLELGRRVVGWTLPLLCILGCIYALAGRYLPGFLAHRGLSMKIFINTMSLTTEGIFGMPLGVSATYVFMFVLFGAFLGGCGGGVIIIDLARCLVGGVHGGAGKAATVASALFGSISGSAVANVMATGTLTIPMMKKMGYPPYFAGAVVAAAATGGTIMPPVMGSVAFIAAEFMQTSYAQVALAAAIPALLYYGALFAIVDLRARKLGLSNVIPGEKQPDFKETLKKSWITIIPLFVLLYFLIYLRKSALLSSFWATISVIVILFLKERPAKAVPIFFRCLISGGKGAVSSAVGCALAGIIMGVLTRTGVAMKLSAFMIGLAGEAVFPVLCLAAVISLILGMGVTATIAYIIPAMMVVPILVKAGIPPMAANIFVMYFSIISYVTPPVALASYAAATVAESDFWKTGLAAFKLGLSGFIIPFMVAYGPSLVLVGSPFRIAWSCCTAVTGIILLACSLEGWLNGPVPLWGRIVLFCAALLLVEAGVITDAAGVVLALATIAFQLRRKEAIVAK